MHACDAGSRGSFKVWDLQCKGFCSAARQVFLLGCRARVDELAEAYLQKKSKDMEAASSSRAGPVGGGQAGPPLERPQCKWQRQVRQSQL